jgi:YbgC/YbaW family acyl-CoA thioester hydrolase
VFVGRHAIEVGWGDCDPARIVFFPRYFEWFEICTTAMFRSAGLPLHELFAERNMVGIPLLDVGARFHFGSAYGHILEVESRVTEWKAKTFRVEHQFSATAGSRSRATRCGSGPCRIRPARSRCARPRFRRTWWRASWART